MDYLLNLILLDVLLMLYIVLNLIINGLPSKRNLVNQKLILLKMYVLNLIINGLPSKRGENHEERNNFF